jgi:hypothetical protein
MKPTPMFKHKDTPMDLRAELSYKMDALLFRMLHQDASAKPNPRNSEITCTALKAAIEAVDDGIRKIVYGGINPIQGNDIPIDALIELTIRDAEGRPKRVVLRTSNTTK